MLHNVADILYVQIRSLGSRTAAVLTTQWNTTGATGIVWMLERTPEILQETRYNMYELS